MEVTAGQRAAIAHSGPRLVVAGGPGTGKTTTLIERWRQLAAGLAPSRVLVLCPTRGAADRFVQAILPDLRQGFDALPVTTVYGLAHDVLTRSGTPVSLAAGAERRVTIRRLLAAEDPGRWPVLGRYLGRPGFAAEVAAALDLALDHDLDAVAGAGEAWRELAGFARRFTQGLESAGQATPAGLLAAAAGVIGAHRARFDHVLVDDAHRLSPTAARLVSALTSGPGPSVTISVDPGAGEAPAGLAGEGTVGEGTVGQGTVGEGTVEVPLSQSFRVAPPGRLITCDHPSVEAEAIAAELIARHRAGVAWSGMAVVVRSLGRRARSIGRALARHGIPVVAEPALAAGEPVVGAMIDLLHWVDGDGSRLERLLATPLAGLDPLEVRTVRRESRGGDPPLDGHPRLAPLVALRDHLRHRQGSGDTPADLAYEIWRATLAGAGTDGSGAVDDRALDGITAFVDGLADHARRHPGATLAATLAAVEDGALVPEPWRVSASAGPEGVTICTIAAAEGREWPAVVVAGCVEGELPRDDQGPCLFDPGLFDPGIFGPRPAPLARERRLFAVAASRSTEALIATAAPAAGVLLSRFVEAWPVESARLAGAPGQARPPRPPTAGATPISPDDRLVLSATQLDTYDDCPLRYAYQYVLRARDEPGVHAGLGTLVHEVLAEFCDPDRPGPPLRSLDDLLEVATAHWRDDVARFRPQLEEVRRDLVAMLRTWWEQEYGQLGFGPEVLAVERGFDIEVGPHRLRGTIDRMDRAGKDGVAVIDYKTGKREPRPEDVAVDLQLAVYHLAVSRDETLAGLGAPARLQLRYLRSGKVFDQPITPDHAARTEARVLEVADLILAEEFEPSVDANCRNCNFHRLCPLQEEGRPA